MALGNAAIWAAKEESRFQSGRGQVREDLGAIPVVFESQSGLFSENKTHVVFLFSTTCPACEESTKRTVKESYLTWVGNLSYHEVSLNIINYYKMRDIEEAYFKAFSIPENKTGEPVLVIHNSKVGLVYYPPFENTKVQNGVYYLTRGSPLGAVQTKGEPGFSQPLIYALGTISGFNPCLIALASFFFASATQTELKRTARRIGLISLGLVYAYTVSFSLIISNPTIMNSLAASTWLIASILVTVGLLHFAEVAQDLHSRKWGRGINVEAKVPLFRTPRTLKGFLVRARELNSPVHDFGLGIIFSLIKLPCIAALFLFMLVNSTTPLIDTAIFTFGVASPIILMGMLIGFGMLNVNRLTVARFKGRLIQRTAIGVALLVSAFLIVS